MAKLLEGQADRQGDQSANTANILKSVDFIVSATGTFEPPKEDKENDKR